MRELLITPQFQKDSRKIPEYILEESDLVLSKLKENPLEDSLNISKLKGFKPPIWRVRIGSYRIAYSFNEKFLICLRFRHRKDIYKDL